VKAIPDPPVKIGEQVKTAAQYQIISSSQPKVEAEEVDQETAILP
jgi:hypothetical protein